jgi:hypothetical protein
MARADITRLGIDFGTSSTVAVIQVGGRPPRPLLFDGSPLLPSAVCADPTGRMLVGRDAVQLATAAPAGFEPHPKRCVDEGSVLLAGRDVPVGDLFRAVFARVTEHASRFGDGPPSDVVVTHPAGWGAARKAVLAGAAPAGARFVAEPVAAAHYFVDIAGHRLAEGATALVYDLGAGTFDASLVRREGDEFAVVAATGLPDAGGLDIDAAIVAYLRATVDGDETWARLTDAVEGPAGHARRQLWDNVRAAKEVLSRLSTTLIHLPLFEVDVPLGREQLDRLAAPVIDRTVRATRDLLASAGDRPGAVFLAGGASRMPAVGTALHRALGIAPSLVDEPELAVAEGALRVPAPGTVTQATGPPGADDAWPPTAALPVPPARRPRRAWIAVRDPARRRGRAWVAAAAVVLLLLGGTAAWAALSDERPDGFGAAPSASIGASPGATASPTPSHPPGIDPCLLGTWRMELGQIIGNIFGEEVQYSGGRGTLRVFGADGVSVLDYGKAAPMKVRHRGVNWTMNWTGTIKARYYADGKRVRWLSATPDGTVRLWRNGKLNAKSRMTARIEPDDYTCSADRMSWASTQGKYSAEWVRVR